MVWRVGVDIGGAFTDLYALDQKTGKNEWIKVESHHLILKKEFFMALMSWKNMESN